MESLIRKIDNLVKTLAALKPIKAEYKSVFDQKIRLEFSYNSNHIEGNTLTYGETKLLLLFDKTTGNHDLREYEEMKAHDVAFDMIKSWATETHRNISETDIKNLNEILLIKPFWKEAQTPDGNETRRLIKVGAYKEFPNSVRLQNGEIFHYASPIDTPILMGELLEWYSAEETKNELHPVALAALFHYKFVCIHPFDDGNGRISRLIMNYVLLRHNLPPIIIKTSDKKNYLFALNQADSGDLNAFIKYIAAQLVWSLELSLKAAMGESLEEPDDLDKEISVWKKGIINGGPKKSDKLVSEIYEKGINEFFKSLVIEIKKKFSDLFDDNFEEYQINNNLLGKSQFQLLQLDKIVKNEPISKLALTINLLDYLYSIKSPFSIYINIEILFEPTKYRIIKFRDELLSEKIIPNF